jgi:fumarate reductase flavoprotein subunit
LAFAQDFPDFVSAQNAGAVQHAADAAALAQLIGCSLGTLQATLSAIRPMTDKATGRSFKRALQAPFHAIKVTGALFHTQGGLDIDAQARVLREDGTPLPNLLAAGGAARGVSGQAVWGYLSGNGLLSAIAGGHIAAQTAQQLLKDAAL